MRERVFVAVLAILLVGGVTLILTVANEANPNSTTPVGVMECTVLSERVDSILLECDR